MYMHIYKMNIFQYIHFKTEAIKLKNTKYVKIKDISPSRNNLFKLTNTDSF